MSHSQFAFTSSPFTPLCISCVLNRKSFVASPMAYAALVSLSQILDQFPIHRKHPPLLIEREQLDSLKQNVCTILLFLENYSHTCSGSINLMKSRIIDAAYNVEDIIESHFLSLRVSKSKLEEEKSSQSFSSNIETQGMELHKMLQEMDSIREEVMKIKHNVPERNNSPLTLSESTSCVSTVSHLNDTNTMIGFDDDYMVIKKRMNQNSSYFSVIPIVGMGGIGKSTLCKRLYEDSIRAQHFDLCLWIVVSQDYSVREILLKILGSNEEQGIEAYQKDTNSNLAERVHKKLFGRRYLVVADDIWTTKAWDDLNRILPKDTKGSRVLVTTRLLDVATYVGSSSSSSNPPHEMHLLSVDQSWSLLRERVLGKGSCPSQAVEHIGKKIAKSCQGLPLTIVVVAGLLMRNTTEYWENISHNICSQEPTIALHCSKVLSLSYERLPLYLQPCFLYVAAFPEDHEISADRLIKLWMAEGFVKPSASKCLEEMAEEYLRDLVGRSLLLVSRKRYDGKIYTVSIHDMLRDIGISKASEEKFHYHDILESMKGKQRRLSIHSEKSMNRLAQIHDPTTRSLLIFPHDHWRLMSFLNFRFLRTLDVLVVALDSVPIHLVHLRFLAFKYIKTELPKSLSKLRKLQTLIVHGRRRRDMLCALHVPHQILLMASLRHLIFVGVFCLDLNNIPKDVHETNLQTLSQVTNVRLAEEVVKMLVNVRKLGLYYLESQRRKLSNLVHLEKLEELKIIFEHNRYIDAHDKLAFPPSLKMLTLENSISHSNYDHIINAICCLPKLEVLTIRGFYISNWNPTEGQFPELKYLKLSNGCLSQWEEDSIDFPSLEILSLESIFMLKEIPKSIGDIDALKQIKLNCCTPSIVASAKQIQADQQEMGNELQLVLEME